MNKKEFKWGLGIEHEMHLFHMPKSNIVDYLIVFDAESAINRLLKNHKKNKIRLLDSDIDFLKSIPFELSGRVCNGKKIIEKIPIKMPELITSYPFCSVNRERTKAAKEDIFEFKKKLIKLIKKDEISKALIKEYGDLDEHPYGMSRYVKYGIVRNNKYVFKQNLKTREDKLYTDYTGSYHVTITLPYTEKTTDNEFIKMHQNFCNQLQWIEPLLMIGFFSGDEYAPGSFKDRVRGSYRMMNVGWGNIAGSDVRLFNKGIGRYAKTKMYWREKFLLHETKNLKPCIKPSVYAKKEGGITSYGTDFRTFGENKKGIRVSGYPMKKPNGIEIRIFDNFDSRYIQNLLLFLFLVVENSFKTKTSDYCYENKIWIETMRNIMTYGYTAKINKKYIDLINNKLKIKVKSEENTNLYNCLLKALYNKNKNGFYYKLLSYVKDEEFRIDKISRFYMNINQKSWELAFYLKLIRNPKILTKFNQLLKIIIYLEKITYEKIQDLIVISLGNNWKNDIDNILIYLRETRFVNYKNITYQKNYITINKERNYNELSLQNCSNTIKFIMDDLRKYDISNSYNILKFKRILRNNNNQNENK